MKKLTPVTIFGSRRSARDDGERLVGRISPRRVAAAIFRGEIVELLLQRRIEPVGRRREAVVELLGTARAQQRRGDGGIGERPGDRQRRQRTSRFARRGAASSATVAKARSFQ